MRPVGSWPTKEGEELQLPDGKEACPGGPPPTLHQRYPCILQDPITNPPQESARPGRPCTFNGKGVHTPELFLLFFFFILFRVFVLYLHLA